MENRFSGGWEELESQQQFRIDDIAVDSLVDEWDRLVHDEPQLDELQLDEETQLDDEFQLDGFAPQSDEQPLDDYDVQLDSDGVCMTSTPGPQYVDSHAKAATPTNQHVLSSFTDLLTAPSNMGSLR
ncbi:uncharacterized protein IUM83_13528 [Phytophthora cinnamomi]|uniref:uncharacterized protein n=1 Tax=Phytophthora cinnamomi TaxID=4785 RepID=UPI00355AA110|nr:hypothetical protein IUM83_13528 [Phytophthora cinnamomi]